MQSADTAYLWFLPARRYASAGASHGPVSVCLCLSVTSRYSIKTVERIGLVLAWELLSTYPTLCYKKNLGTFKNKGTSLWKFAPNSELRIFRHSISIVEACYQLSSRKVDAQSVINWAVVGSTKLIIPQKSDARPL